MVAIRDIAEACQMAKVPDQVGLAAPVAGAGPKKHQPTTKAKPS
jgi:hypothetical protein